MTYRLLQHRGIVPQTGGEGEGGVVVGRADSWNQVEQADIGGGGGGRGGNKRNPIVTMTAVSPP